MRVEGEALIRATDDSGALDRGACQMGNEAPVAAMQQHVPQSW
jgi:hypothetical protein